MTQRPKGFLVKSFLYCCFAFLSQPVAAGASQSEANLCDLAADYATRVEPVPGQILKAIARTESGRSLKGELKPWPWAINIEGNGVWLSSQTEAITRAKQQYALGTRNFDVGCFQLNYKWHGSHFSSLEQMFDPYENALYAARFLKTLHAELGTWSAAVGAYHSRNRQFSQPYLKRFHTILSALDASTPVHSTLISQQNTFPLLRGTAQSHSLGSLFPDADRRPQHLFSNREVRR